MFACFCFIQVMPEMMRVPSQTQNCLYIEYKIWQPRPIFSNHFQPIMGAVTSIHRGAPQRAGHQQSPRQLVGRRLALELCKALHASAPTFQTASKLLPKCFQMPNASKNSAISFHFIPFLFVCLVQGATAELDRADSRLMSLSWAGLMYVNA